MKDEAMNDSELERKLRSYFAAGEMEAPAGLMARLAHPVRAQERPPGLERWRRLLAGGVPASRPLSAALAVVVLVVVVGVSLLMTSPGPDETPGARPELALQSLREARDLAEPRMSLAGPLVIADEGVHIRVEADPPPAAGYDGTVSDQLAPISFSARAEYRTDGGQWQDAGTVEGQASDDGIGLDWRLPKVPPGVTTFEFRVTEFGTSERPLPVDEEATGHWHWLWKAD